MTIVIYLAYMSVYICSLSFFNLATFFKKLTSKICKLKNLATTTR